MDIKRLPPDIIYDLLLHTEKEDWSKLAKTCKYFANALNDPKCINHLHVKLIGTHVSDKEEFKNTFSHKFSWNLRSGRGGRGGRGGTPCNDMLILSKQFLHPKRNRFTLVAKKLIETFCFGLAYQHNSNIYSFLKFMTKGQIYVKNDTGFTFRRLYSDSMDKIMAVSPLGSTNLSKIIGNTFSLDSIPVLRPIDAGYEITFEQDFDRNEVNISLNNQVIHTVPALSAYHYYPFISADCLDDFYFKSQTPASLFSIFKRLIF